jgi:retron-type reverse transcriptase
MTEQSGAAENDTNGEEPQTKREKRKCTPDEVVRSLQARIVKAQEAGKHNKVKALQYLLTRSQSARILAVERVTENDGSKTPGVDKET